ncbi:MAG: VCBS repeat-containing protein [Verrucomicrobiales bacterium]|nr:VCBS repeat-containing protein [Verrucomicrobiales bacterium]
MIRGPVVWADFDNDGDLDLVLTRSSGMDGPKLLTHVFRNDGGEKFTELEVGFTGVNEGDLVVGDIDRDGKLDLALSGGELDESGWAKPIARIYRNLGDLNFALTLDTGEELLRGPMDLGDYDRDGDLDLLRAGQNPYFSPFGPVIEANDGTGRFSPVPIESPRAQSARMTWEDYDVDGELDAVFGQTDVDKRWLVRRNLGENRFAVVPSPDPRINGFFVGWADLDGDGDLDAVGQSQERFWPQIILNDGAAGFSASVRPLLEFPCWSVCWGDADNDGDLDGFFMTWQGPSSRLGLNDGAANFSLAEGNFPSGSFGSHAAWGDFDNDGDLDLIYTTACEGQDCTGGTTLYRNDSPRRNTPPSAPSGQKATLQAVGDLKLEWNAASDAETTQPRLLTYEVRMGTAPGRYDIIAPPSDTVTGRRRVADFGSERATFRWVRNLPKGTYYWSVQSVDTAFAGSAWAPEQTVTITNTPPTVSVIPAQAIALSQNASISFSVADLESPGTMTLRAESENEPLMPAANFALGGSGTNRTLRFQPAPGMSGVTRIAIIADDGQGLFTRRSFQVTVEEFTVVPMRLPYETFGLELSPAPPADYDGDGDLDVYLYGQRRRPDNFFEAFSVLLKNDGRGNFSIGPDVQGPATMIGAALDFEHDGDVDLVSQFRLDLNRGDGTFISRELGLNEGKVFAGDINGDGAIDFATRLSPGGVGVEPKFHFNRGDKWETRGLPLGPSHWESPEIFHLGDFDRDGDLDLLSGVMSLPEGSTNRMARLFLNDGDGAIAQTVDSPMVMDPQSWITWVADADADGDLDIFLNGSMIMMNDGAGHFLAKTLDSRAGLWSLDYDNDGDADLFENESLAESGRIWWGIKPTDSSGQQRPFIPLSEFVAPPPLMGDFDGDGDLDLLAIAFPNRLEDQSTPAFLHLFRNNCDRPNVAPAAPTSLRASIRSDQERVQLQWDGAGDDHTPTQLLSYNLRLGTTPGGIEIVAPHPLIAQEGNNGRTPLRTLSHLPPGKYYWSVQALDAQFQRGPWAAEQSFTLDKPGIAPLADVTTPPDTPSLPITLHLTGDSTTTADDLIVNVRSENTDLIPLSGLSVSGTGPTRSLVITPAHRDGEGFVEVVATGTNGIGSSRRFLVTVRQFEERRLGVDRWSNQNLQWLDLDADGDLDLISSGIQNFGAADITFWENQPTGEVLLRTNALPLAFQGRVFAGDAGGDNRPDLFLSGTAQAPPQGAREGRLWTSATGFAFAPESRQLTNVQLVAEFLDRDGDAHADVAFWGTRNSFGLGADLFLEESFGLSEEARTNLCAFVWSDLDGDGDLDGVLSSTRTFGLSNTNYVGVWRNDGGRYVPIVTALPSEPARIAASDLDGDGLPDIIFGRLYSWPDKDVEIWRGLGNFRFERSNARFPWHLNGVPAVGDYDNDGDPDLLMTRARRGDEQYAIEAQGTVALFRNNGNLQFQREEFSFPKMTVEDAAWGDLDNDGDLDLAVLGDDYGSPYRLLFVNSSFRSNAAPNVPNGLSTSPIPNGVLLSWTPADDAESSRFLSYNLRVGQTPQGSEIISALADPMTGQRRSATSGNAASAPRWQMVGLPNGTYYWTVQAVDAGYAASKFAPEQSFTISRPVLTGLSNLVVLPNRASGPFGVTVTDARTSPADLKLSITARDEWLIPQGSLSLGGTGTNRTFELTPAPHRSGKTTLVVTAENRQGEVTTAEIELTVREELEAVQSTLPALSEGVAAWADIDADGDLDLFLGGFQADASAAGYSALWRNDHGVITTDRVASFNEAGDGAAAFADADHDGNLDLVVSGGSGTTILYFDAGHPEHGLAPRTLSPAARSAVAWGDLNSDGRQDLLVTGSRDGSYISGNVISLYQNALPATFFGESPFYPGLRDGEAIWFDADRDGDDDLLLNGSKEWTTLQARTALLMNNRGSLFDMGGDLPQLNFAAAAVADYNLDDAPDILMFGERWKGAPTPVTVLLRNDGMGRFIEVSTPFPAFTFGSAAWGDYDGDGDPDLLLSGLVNDSPRTELWINQGESGFSLSDARFSSQGVLGVAWGDMDGDQDLDLAMVGPLTGKGSFTGLFRNSLDPPPKSPPVPLELRAIPDGTDVILSWRMPLGSPHGLTFNLRAGTSPGGIDVITPMSDVTTGRRFLPKPGNAGWSFQRRIRNHAGRPLFWAVQSISPAYVASPFSIEHDALVSRNESPTIADVPLQVGAMNQVVGPVQVWVNDTDHDARALEVVFTSMTPGLIKGVEVSGQGGSRTLTVTPVRNASGLGSIQVVARDPLGASTTNEVRISFRAVTEVAADLPQVLLSSFEPGDYDHDGDVDLFLAGWEPTELGSGKAFKALLQNRGGTFVPVDTGALPSGEVRASWGDADGDSDLDLAANGAWFRNDSADFLAAPSSLDGRVNSVWGDLDNDGDLDLVWVGGNEQVCRILENVGGQFMVVDANIPGVWDGAVALGDADNDGDLDLAISGRENASLLAYPKLRIYRNDQGRFSNVIELSGVSRGVLQWADANNDGRVDLLVAGMTPDGTRERLFLNQGGYRFTETYPGLTTGGVGPMPGAMLFDFDNDGDLDLGEYTASALFSVRLNDGSGAFSPKSNAAANTPAALFRVADLDADGDYDILVSGPTRTGSSYDGTVKWYRNHWIRDEPELNQLMAVVRDNEVELSWPAQTNVGVGTPPTYNLRVGTRSGGIDIVSPLSHLATGRRMVAQAGNMGFARRTLLRGLAPGTYWWSVQAVDSGGVGWPFAEEAQFTIAAASSQLRIQSITVTETPKLTIAAPAGWSATLETSSDLRAWAPLQTVKVGADGKAELTLPPGSAYSFFRIRYP